MSGASAQLMEPLICSNRILQHSCSGAVAGLRSDGDVVTMSGLKLRSSDGESYQFADSCCPVMSLNVLEEGGILPEQVGQSGMKRACRLSVMQESSQATNQIFLVTHSYLLPGLFRHTIQAHDGVPWPPPVVVWVSCSQQGHRWVESSTKQRERDDQGDLSGLLSNNTKPHSGEQAYLMFC